MGDYPDYTTLMQILGTEVTIPIEIKAVTVAHIDIDIAAQTIGNLAVNIAASAITLNVNIASITGGVTFNIGTVSGTVNVAIASSAVTLNVNIAASAITLNVNISSITGGVTFNIGTVSGTVQVNIASTTANIGIDIKAATIGNLTIDIETQSVGVYLQPDWQVKAGTDKNLYGAASINNNTETLVIDYQVTAGKTFYICQWGFLLSDNYPIWGRLRYKHDAAITYVANNGGYMGAAQSFTKPIAVVAGDYVQLGLYQRSGATAAACGSVGGYEI